jgi:hypothetical protein
LCPVNVGRLLLGYEGRMSIRSLASFHSSFSLQARSTIRRTMRPQGQDTCQAARRRRAGSSGVAREPDPHSCLIAQSIDRALDVFSAEAQARLLRRLANISLPSFRHTCTAPMLLTQPSCPAPTYRAASRFSQLYSARNLDCSTSPTRSR